MNKENTYISHSITHLGSKKISKNIPERKKKEIYIYICMLINIWINTKQDGREIRHGH